MFEQVIDTLRKQFIESGKCDEVMELSREDYWDLCEELQKRGMYLHTRDESGRNGIGLMCSGGLVKLFAKGNNVSE